MTLVDIIETKYINQKKHIIFYIGDKRYDRTIIRETKKGSKYIYSDTSKKSNKKYSESQNTCNK